MYAIHIAAGQIALGAGDAFIAAGVESMTMVPQGGFNFSPNPRFKRRGMPDAELLTEAYIAMGETAENVAQRYRVSRSDQEQLAFESQMKAAAAQNAGRLEEEIVPVKLPDGSLVARDGCLRPTTTLEGLAALKAAFREDGTVTAGTASRSQAVACLRELGIDRDRVNLDGGGISIGHPLGATGARITAKAAQILRREGKRYALATQCIGGGQGIATILEAL
jgi:acetyl-CoA acetyltransferase